MKNGLTITMIFEANAANYGEGFSNITQMKTLTRGDYQAYPYISRQAIRYNIVEQLGWNNTPVDNSKGVVQFSGDTSIKDYPEIDLFGYMKTAKKKDNEGNTLTRNAVVRLSHAIGLEPFKGDMDYLTNMGLANRIGKNNNAIALSEIQRSFYTYTVTIDLDLIGIDTNDGTNIDSKEKAERVCKLLETIQFLYRDIKGRRENLAPVFVVGGIYHRKNPFFINSISLKENRLNISAILDLLKVEEIAENTKVGLLQGTFKNEEDIKEKLMPLSIADFFKDLREKVINNYESNSN